MANLVEHSDFSGTVYLINRTKPEINGRKCWPSVVALPATPDLVVIAVPAESVMEVLTESADRGVAFAIILTSGFGEVGEEGLKAEQQMRDIAARSGMRLYGPNCPGLCNVNSRLGFTFSPAFQHDLRSGPIGLATQGGGLGRNVMQAMDRGAGIGLWCSTGNEVDLQVSDFIHYMADAPDIRVIVTLLEGIKDGARFVRAVQHAARMGKPVIGLKVGRSEYGRKAAQSHTASITGSAEVNSAAFKQLGVIEVDDIDELIDTAWLFVRQMPGARSELGVYCSSGGTTALTADMIGTAGLTLATFAPQTLAVLASCLPSYAAINNPVDTTTAVMSNVDLIDATMLAVCQDPGVALVVLPFALDYGDTTLRTAEAAIRVQKQSPVPIVPIWMSDRAGSGFQALAQAGMVPIRSAGKAAKAIKRWCDYAVWRAQADLSFRPLILDRVPVVTNAPDHLPSAALPEPDGKRWLQAAGIAVPKMDVATSEAQAVAIAEKIGFPVVAKIVSPDIQHKSDVGGVRVGLTDAAAVRAAWAGIHTAVKSAMPKARIEGLLIEQMLPAGGVETLIGVSRDPVLGHMLTFGLGGVYVEIFKDVSRRLLPLSAHEADAMVREVRSYPLLSGARGRAACDVGALRDVLLKVSAFVVAHADDIDEMDLNPVWVGPAGQGAVALDAVIVGRMAGRAE